MWEQGFGTVLLGQLQPGHSSSCRLLPQSFSPSDIRSHSPRLSFQCCLGCSCTQAGPGGRAVSSTLVVSELGLGSLQHPRLDKSHLLFLVAPRLLHPCIWAVRDPPWLQRPCHLPKASDFLFPFANC